MAETYLKTGKAAFDSLVPRIEKFLAQDLLEVVVDGRTVRGYRSPDAKSIWIRDYSDMLRGLKYFEKDVRSTVEEFARTQATDGQVHDYFTTVPQGSGQRENWTQYVRVPVEADVEFRFVKAAWLAFQATGDESWIEGLLPALEQALDYVFNHPWRFDQRTGLIKRAYTIDTWDFAYTAGRHDWLQFQIDDDTFWGVMHGDVSGYFEACRILSRLRRAFGDEQTSLDWLELAESLRKGLDRHAWNGRFYTHFVKLTPVEIEGVDEAQQLSLSNPMDINRRIASHEQAVSILGEYRRRGAQSGSFAEWFSIDPPFPDGAFGDPLLKGGAYCNGGIMPLVGGELARAAFQHGCESYGAEILERYHALVAKKNETYLWYHPDGTPSSLETSTSPDAMPTDGWGSSAMLYALLEGMAGITDQWCSFQRARIAPRFIAAGLDEAEVQVGYAASGAKLGYGILHRKGRLRLSAWADRSEVDFHVLLPEATAAATVRVNGNEVPFTNLKVEESRYTDFAAKIEGGAEIEITLEQNQEPLP